MTHVKAPTKKVEVVSFINGILPKQFDIIIIPFSYIVLCAISFCLIEASFRKRGRDYTGAHWVRSNLDCLQLPIRFIDGWWLSFYFIQRMLTISISYGPSAHLSISALIILMWRTCNGPARHSLTWAVCNIGYCFHSYIITSASLRTTYHVFRQICTQIKHSFVLSFFTYWTRLCSDCQSVVPNSNPVQGKYYGNLSHRQRN